MGTTKAILGAIPLVAILASVAPAAPIDTFLFTDLSGNPITVDRPYYSETGTWFDATPAPYLVGIGGRRGTGASDTATWTPSLNPGFVAGDYTVQLHYPFGHTTFTTVATYSINGSDVATLSQKTAPPPVAVLANPLPRYVSNTISPSGWYTFGGVGTKYNLSGGVTPSTIKVTKTASGDMLTNAVRIAAGVDVILDKNQYADQSPSYTGWVGRGYNNSLPQTSESMTYDLATPGNATSAATGLTYSLGGITGAVSVYVSWATHTGQSTDARFILDLDGNFLTTGDQTTFDRDESKYADQTTNGPSNAVGNGEAAWSGWSQLGTGTFNLTATSKIELFNADGSNATYLSADSIRVAPEPAAFTVLAAGVLASLTGRRRRL